MNRLYTALALGLLLSVSSASAQVTNFSRDVAASIDLGLAYLDGRGAFNNPSAAGDAAGLTALALLEKRESADQNAGVLGYNGANDADKARMRTVLAYIINRSRGASFYAYRDGADMMALSVFIHTGGPDQAGALASLNALVDRVIRFQNGGGYWCYHDIS